MLLPCITEREGPAGGAINRWCGVGDGTVTEEAHYNQVDEEEI